MATISPFRAWHYDVERVPIRQVVTQPYDKITPAMQASYYEASPYNLVRIELGQRFAEDTGSDNVYTRAASSFQNWRQTGVLRQDTQPSLYRYSQTFRVPGSDSVAERRAFIALGRLEDYSNGVIFRHEQTLSKPKADRLDLLRATRAHFGQLFMLYNGAGEIDAMLDSVTAPAASAVSNATSAIEVTDEYDVVHLVQKVSGPAVVASVQKLMRDRKLIIADGHHRYETALAYRDECNAKERRPPGPAAVSAPHDWVMMTFVDMDSPGLVILPTHRVVFGLPSSVVAQFPANLGKFFSVEEVDAEVDAARVSEILRRGGQGGPALLAVSRDRAFLMHSPKVSGTALFGSLSTGQQMLDVVQLHKCVLEGCLQISEEAIRNQQNVSYVREAGEALAQVRDGRAQIAFLMNPVRMKQVRDLAFAGEVLPQKSTDFYPKLLSGLTIYALD